MSINDEVKIVEVGARDGLQNEKQIVATKQKIKLINDLAATGIKHIETTSFVSPKWVPQMADAAEVYLEIDKQANVHYPVLIPNQKGLEAALEVGVQDIAIFAAASEAFSQKNINCNIDESLERYADVVKIAQEQQLTIRGYVSCVLGCPYQGDVPLKTVCQVAKALYQMGCHEISLGDTIGIGTPTQAKDMIRAVSQEIPISILAAHFHDTYGQALANIVAVIDEGVRIIDSSVAGLGGCPYAPGASGNVATEDVIYMLHGMGIETGICLGQLIQVGDEMSTYLQRQNQSKVARAILSKQQLPPC